MSPSKPGVAVPSTVDADEAWRVFQYFNPASAAEPRLSFASGWRRRELELVKATDWGDLSAQISTFNVLMQGLLGAYETETVQVLDPEMRKAVLQVLAEQALLSGLIDRLDRLTALFEEWRLWHETES